MRALRIIGISLLSIVVVFFLLGLLVPSYEYESSTEVNASPEKCWKTFHNVKLMNQWIPGFESLTLKGGDSLAVGSLYEIIITEDDHRMVMSEQITEVSAPSKVSYELNNDVLKSEFSYSFEGTSSTTIKGHYKVTGNNMMWKSILFLSKSYMTGATDNQLASLKKVIETQP